MKPMDTLPNLDAATHRRHLANAIRALAMDAVQAANSGHPGMPMGMADIAQVLWSGPLKHNPANPHWANRDRFVLSNGHGSMLLYAVLNLTGYDLPMSEIRNFRQLHSKTPGHPEYGITPGVECTTGPLGQGIGMAVGMALAERLMAAEFNKPGHEIVDHRTFVFCGDGCLMEGISHESCSMAGVLGLEKLVLFYDDNGISIDGHVSRWFADDTPKRFEAYGWRVIPGVDGHDAAALQAAVAEALTPCGKPTLICCKTTIGWGAPTKAGSHDSHGSPLGAAEVAAAREALGWTAPPFEIPEDVRAAWDGRAAGAAAEAAWNARFAAYASAYPAEAAEFTRRMAGHLPADFTALSDAWIVRAEAADAAIASRKSSQLAIAELAPRLPEFFGGSADLTGSVFTDWKGCIDVGPTGFGNYAHWGVREFGMAAAMNGIALHGGYIPSGGTFLVFSDYMRNALRLAALMKIRSIYVLTHDSIGVGEDGPTHQPIEQLVALRSIPGMIVIRPGDANEVAEAWRHVMPLKEQPACLILSRQALPTLDRTKYAPAAGLKHGAYVLADPPEGEPEVILMATGSELSLVVGAYETLTKEGIRARVVSFPSWELFEAQPVEYRNSVLPPHITARVSVEQASTMGWDRYVGSTGAAIGMHTFGASAPLSALLTKFGFTPDAVAAAARRQAGHA